MKERYIIISIAILSLLLLGLDIASAETGSVSVAQYTTVDNYVQAITGGGTTEGPDWTKILVDNTTFSTIDFFRLKAKQTTFALDSESTSFTIVSGGTNACMCGTVVMEKASLNISWYFNTITLNSNTLVLSYSNNIFANITLGATPNSQNTVLSVTQPAFIKGTTAGKSQRALGPSGLDANAIAYYFTGSVSTSNSYVVTYPTSTTFDIQVTKSTIATKVYVNSSTTSYVSDSTFNTNPLGYAGIQLDGIYLNVTLSGGAYNNVLINASGCTGCATPTPTPTPTINPLCYEIFQCSQSNIA